MCKKVVIEPGSVFKRLTLVKEVEPRVRKDGKIRRMVLCRCVCGKEKEIIFHSFSTGRVASCGCLQSEVVSAGKYSKKHGLSSNPIFSVWRKMMARCYDKKHTGYENYGGRGIIVCKSWHNPNVFVEWCLNNGWRSDLTLDRKDNNGIYKPSNCRFATLDVQLYNRRNTVSVTFKGVKRPLLPLLRELGNVKNYNKLRNLIKNGIEISDYLESL